MAERNGGNSTKMSVLYIIYSMASAYLLYVCINVCI